LLLLRNNTNFLDFTRRHNLSIRVLRVLKVNIIKARCLWVFVDIIMVQEQL